MPVALWYVLAAAIVLYLALRFNQWWVYALLDRARRNGRDAPPPAYDRPRYYTRGPDGRADPAARWPGWDGWYIFVVPDDSQLPIHLVRGSLMTGLYGLNGIDNETELSGLSPFHADEWLLFTARAGDAGGAQHVTELTQRYFPKAASLRLETDRVDIRIETPAPGPARLTAAIEGSWPNYRMDFTDPPRRAALSLEYEGRHLVWWADVPGVFTYFAAFGRFRGMLRYRVGADELETPVTGMGSFEHGFARKPFGFNALWMPVRLVQALIPSWKPVRYHYELLIGEGDFHGGFMIARGFGIDFRNLGGIYVDGTYHAISRAAVTYVPDPDRDLLSPLGGGRAAVVFPGRWRVRAATEAGVLEYEAVRDWPPARIASNMMYYHMRYEGTFQGRPVRGRGYGEYVHL